MLKRVLLSLTFVAALAAAGLGTASKAEAGHGCGYYGGYGGYGHRSYYPSYYGHYGHGYGPSFSYYRGFGDSHYGHYGHGRHGHRRHHHGHHHGGVSFSIGF
jgi:hypothetical protein